LHPAASPSDHLRPVYDVLDYFASGMSEDEILHDFPGLIHEDVGLREATDTTIWAYAAQHSLAIVTKDADFRQRSFLEGYPPKILWIRVGNWSKKSNSVVG
jgi:predicted nuclease of predicted toxin-antitoxin system